MGPGKWFRGKIVSERWTDKNDLVYECVFHTPLQHSHWYTEIYAHKAVQCFQNEMVAHGWQCATDPASFVEESLTVGDVITRWFSIGELPKNFVDKEGVQGANVEGIIAEIDCKKKDNLYKCSFDAPVSSEVWLPADETKLLRKWW